MKTRWRENKLWIMSLIFVAILFYVSLFTPMLTVSKLVIVRNTVSIFTGLVDLLNSGEIFIFILIAAFSVALPTFKFATLLFSLMIEPKGNIVLINVIRLMDKMGRWAMLDVLVVALLIVTVKLRVLVDIQIQYGLYLFTLAVVLLLILSNRIHHRMTDYEE